MMKDKWSLAFGNVPDSFSDRVQITVARMQSSSKQAFKPRLVLIMAAVLVLLIGTAFALSQLGVLDTINENLRGFLQPTATELVQTSIQQTVEQPRHASFSIEQAINDGHQIYATVRVHGDDDVLVMDMQAEAAWNTDWWVNANEDGEGQTFSSLAYETNRTLIRATCDVEDEAENLLTPAAPEVHYDGEDILYTVTFPADVPGAYLRLSTYDVYGDDKPQSERLSIGKLIFTVPLTDACSTYKAEVPVDLPIGHMTLTELTVVQTPIATYMTCVYGPSATATDRTYINLKDSIWVDWLDENGESYPEGENAQGLEETGENNTRLVTSYRAFDTLPTTVTLRFRNGMTKECFDVITVTLRPIEKGEIQ